LHTSLRDLSIQACLEADNVVDDIDHVLQANTSLHLTQQETGQRDFVRTTLAQVIKGLVVPRAGNKTVVFSPFGLAALDLAFAEFVARRCAEQKTGLVVPDFLP
jgi:ornithine cyclodeaminase